LSSRGLGDGGEVQNQGPLAFHDCGKIAGKINLKEKFISAHGFRGFSPWSAGSIVLGL
jgi:hypothetical protein